MRRFLALFVVFGLGAVLGGVVGAAAGMHLVPQPVEPTIQSSLVLDDLDTKRFVVARVKSLEWGHEDGSVSHYRIAAPASPNQNVTLKGRMPETIPDHHGKTELALIDLADGKATVAVLWDFDHRSFGKNLRTIDCRIVEVDVTEFVPGEPEGKQ